MPQSAAPVRIWLDGDMVDAEAARFHHLTHTFHYGLGAFEGIRSYLIKPGEGAVFRLDDHVQRLVETCHLITFEDLPFGAAAIHQACIDTLRANALDCGYLRPVVYLGDGAMGIGASTNPVRTMVAAWKWGAYLGEAGMRDGIDTCISSFRRPSHNGVMSKGKLTGQYINSILAKREAVANGFDEAILLNEQGFVSEATGENLFMLRSGALVTPPLTANILAGITRATVLQIAEDLGVKIEERMFARDELYVADEVFLTGTAAEVTPVRSIDRRRVGKGKRGPLTETIPSTYFDIVGGKSARYAHWLTHYTL